MLRKLTTTILALFLTAWASFVAAPIALAQSNIIGGGMFGDVKVSSATYAGPGDVISGATAFWSCRAYNLASVGTKAYRIVRASDSTQTDINSLASGKCDTITPTTFCIATTCKVVTYYDQSGALACAGSTACDLTQGTDANRPPWTASILNSWPCATNLASTIGLVLTTANNLALSQPYTLGGIAERTANFTTAQRILVSNGATVNLGWRGVVNQVGTQAGTIVATAADSAFHAVLLASSNGGTSSLVVDGAATTGTLGALPLALTLNAMNDSAGAGSTLDGAFCEAVIYPILMNATQYGNLNTNMHSATNGWNF